MSAGRSRDSSDLEPPRSSRDHYYYRYYGNGNHDRGRSRYDDSRPRIRVSDSSNCSSRNIYRRTHLSVKLSDKEPGEVSSGEEEVARVRVSNGEVKEGEEKKKKKFSPIIWDRDDGNNKSSVNLRNEKPPPPPLTHGFVSSNLVEEEEEDVCLSRPISSSRWADNDEMEEKEVLTKKRKKPPSPEIQEVVSVREGSEGVGVDSKDLGLVSGRENEVERKDFRDVDVGEEARNGDGPTDQVLDTNSGDGDDDHDDDRRKTLETEIPPQRTINMLQGCRSVDEFEKLNKINEGTYGVVYRAKDKKTGKVVALKKVKMEKEREGFPLTSLREINILLSSNHPSIVDVKEVVVGSSLDSIFMVMEYMEHDLKGLMETMKQPFSQSEVKCLMLQLLSGVKYLHDNWVLHRDLKTSNLLLNNQGELKICDFGLARQYGSPLKPYTHLVVTLWYRAPELLLGVKEYSTAIDMWSLGCIMAEFLAKEPLFNGKTEFDQLDKIFRTLGTPNERIWPGFARLPGVKVNFVKQPPPAMGDLAQASWLFLVALSVRYNKLREKFPSASFSGRRRPTLSEAGFDLLNKLLTYDPEKRITAEAALNHEWFDEVPLPKSKDFMPTFPAQHAQDRRLRRIMKSPDPLEEQRKRELQLGDQLGAGGLFG